MSKKNMSFWLIFSVCGYSLVAVFFFLYTFTQVDLSLTLSQMSVYQVVEKLFQYIGYFNRPLSTGIFIGITSLFFVFYGMLLWFSFRNRISVSFFWKLFLPIVFIMAISYNAFSYDLFNYIFDAKIVTYYQQNPYEHKALDYASDPMLSFMHWTHRTYPYGPVWLGVTIPLSYIGFGYFLPTFFLFKFFIASCFVLTVLAISTIMKLVKPEYQAYALVFFGLNPFILSESLVSAHNDIVMMMFVLWSLYFLISKKIGLSSLFLMLSIGIKFATVLLLPLYGLYFYLKKKQKMQWEALWLCGLVCMVVAVVLAAVRTNFQPWYLLYVLPFLALLSYKYYGLLIGFMLSVFAMLYYVPYLFTGNWNEPIPSILFIYELVSILVIAITIGVYYMLKRKRSGTIR